MVRYILFIGHTFKSKFLRPDYTYPENKRDLMIDHINHCAISSVIRGANKFKKFLSLCQKKISEKKSHNLKNIIKISRNILILFLKIPKSYKKTFKNSKACHLFFRVNRPSVLYATQVHLHSKYFSLPMVL